MPARLQKKLHKLDKKTGKFKNNVKTQILSYNCTQPSYTGISVTVKKVTRTTVKTVKMTVTNSLYNSLHQQFTAKT